MWLLDWLTGKIKCPRCGARGAKEINGAVHCPNPSCSYFSPTMGKGSAVAPQESSAFGQQADAAGAYSSDPSVQAPEGWFAIRYRNFRGQEKTFVAEAAATRRKNNHVSAKVGEGKRMVTIRDPQTGEPRRVRQEKRIALSRDRILNLSEVERSHAAARRTGAGLAFPTRATSDDLPQETRHHVSAVRKHPREVPGLVALQDFAAGAFR